MKNVIIGTAGHIDHGKTTLIRALTGIETDRLKEEKKRGITIELGFAHFDLPSGRRAGIIDVPGHERFIKNMLAGVGGIDIVLLVVAADEGFMPQTQEHLDILSILEVSKGLVVLTKTDLVDEEWLELVKEETRHKIKNTFLEEAPMISVSSITGEGLTDLSALIDQLTEETEEREVNTSFRLPIDRVFSVAGFGTVITGTQIEGVLKEGDFVEIYPTGQTAKVRNIQVHGKNEHTSYPGQRVAINLAGLKKEDITRGNVLGEKNSLKPTMMLDVKLHLLKHSERVVKNRDRLRLYHGTSEVFCRVVLLDLEELKPGEACYAQLRLEEEVVTKRGDHFVVRFYSPMETIGGGIILEPNPLKHKRFKEETLEELKVKEEGTPEDVVEKQINRFSEKFEGISFYISHSGVSEESFLEILGTLVKEESVIKLPGNIIVHRSYLENVEENLITLLNEYHKKNPLKQGMLKEEVRNKLLPQIKGKLYDSVLDLFIANESIELLGTQIALKNFKITYTFEQNKIKDDLVKMYLSNTFNPPSIEEILKNMKNAKEYRQVFNSLVEMNQLIKISEEVVFHYEAYEKAKKIVKDFIEKNGEITLAQFRDCLDTTRKYALPLLEYFDQNKITKRSGDKRILY